MSGLQGRPKPRPEWRGAVKLLFAFQRNQTPGKLETVSHDDTRVDIYDPPTAPMATVIFVPGLAIRGREDPRIRRFGWALCAAGARVLIPDIPSIRALKISARQPAEVNALLKSLAQDRTMVTTDDIALMSVSFSSVFVLRAALDRALADRVSALGLIGGYFDIEKVADFLITSERADPYGRLLIARSYFAEFESAEQGVVAALKHAVERSALDNAQPNELDDLFDVNDPVEKSLHRLLSDPEARRGFLDKVVKVFDGNWAGYRVPQQLPQSMPAVFLLHGRTDPVIPTEESRRLAHRLASQGVAHHLCVSNLLDHGNTAISLRRAVDVYHLVVGFAWFLARLRR
tara:strand:+ start:491 stop:1525 length:1035 start_codon:yes stop_codon:yes gene_type:complete